MATSLSAPRFSLHQVQPKKAKTGAERAKAYRQRKKAEASAPPSAELLIPADFVPPADYAEVPTPVAAPASRPPVASFALMIAAAGLAAVGVTQNGYFARSLGATDVAGWLFLAVGVASDLTALALPAAAARAWQARQKGAALAAWLVWSVAFLFAVLAVIGFASQNVTDVTTARASRVTPGVVTAKDALTDAVTARDRECAHGVGPVCRQREQGVVDRRQALDAAMHAVASTADPQVEAATRLVAWASMGTVRPSGDDFGMLRLMLLALLPQCGGLLVMVARAR
jgi:hypothetical protein